MAAPVKESLVLYENPQLVALRNNKKLLSLPKLDRKAQLPPTADLLNAMIPPREFTQDGKMWIQYISSTPATRMDIITLQENLDLRLRQRQARETGICPIREELYAQCFDELIRQITINCAERGLLLLRVRDEIQQTIRAYQSLYESSVAFGMRKALVGAQRKGELSSKVKILSAEVAELERTVESLTARCESMEAADRERFTAEEEKHAAEVAKLKAGNEQLKEALEALLAPPTGSAPKK